MKAFENLQWVSFCSHFSHLFVVLPIKLSIEINFYNVCCAEAVGNSLTEMKCDCFLDYIVYCHVSRNGKQCRA